MSLYRAYRRLVCRLRGGHRWVGLKNPLVCLHCGDVLPRYGKLGDIR